MNSEQAPPGAAEHASLRGGPVAVRAVLVHIVRRSARGAIGGASSLRGAGSGAGAVREAEAQLGELCSLATAIGLGIAEALVRKLRHVEPATLFGRGQVEELRAIVLAHEARLVVINGEITPIQQKNLEKAFGAKVIDRTALILEIFGERAVTAEGRLQVELAHLQYQAGRLVRSWTHLERQRGGYGFLGGPGETQIETDRRLLRDRIAHLARELEKVRKTRALHRRRRLKNRDFVVALVGYTNAGKSTLFNRLTGSSVMARDILFATLDPTLRAMDQGGGEGHARRRIMLSDTVGFVSDLPTELVAAFRATLEEVVNADLLLHVRDVAHPDSEAQAEDVARVLAELGVATGEGRIPVLEVWNKADRLPEAMRALLAGKAERADDKVLISAVTGEGVAQLRSMIAARAEARFALHDYRLHEADQARLSWLYRHADVMERRDEDGMVMLKVRITAEEAARFNEL